MSTDTATADQEGRGTPQNRSFWAIEEMRPTPMGRGGRLSGTLGWLAHLYILDVYGPWSLSTRARNEMKIASLLLTGILLFELGAWTLLFNVLLHNGVLVLSARTLLAIALGTLFATVVFLYERNFLCADVRGRSVGVFVSFVLRIVLIAAGALITAQPVEILMFAGPIQRRVHEESLRSQAILLLQQLKDLNEKARQLPDYEAAAKSSVASAVIKTQIEPELVKATEDAGKRQVARRASEGQLAALESAASRAQSSLRVARERLSEVQSATDDPDYGIHVREARRQLNRAESEAAQTASDLKSKGSRLQETIAAQAKAEQDAVGAVKLLQDQKVTQQKNVIVDLEGAKSSAEESRKKAVVLLGRVNKFLRRVSAARPGETVYEVGQSATENKAADGFEFHDGDYDFAQRLRVLTDLRESKPARWNEGSEEDKRALIETYGLDFLKENDATRTAYMEQDGKVLNGAYWALFGVALFIPIMVVLQKFLIAKELTAYFARDDQAQMGNPEAQMFKQAEERRKREKEEAARRRETEKEEAARRRETEKEERKKPSQADAAA